MFSPQVLVGAPAQGCSSPLIRVRIKCSLRADSLTLRHGESPTTGSQLELGHPQAPSDNHQAPNDHQAI